MSPTLPASNEEAVAVDPVSERQLLPSQGRAAQWKTWFTWRKGTGFARVEAAVLAAYIALVAITICFHEAWTDEAQAWLIARDNSYWNIFRWRLHYEGTPALWPFLLHTLHLLHVPFPGINWFGAACATAGVYAWLRWSPFPRMIRYLLPFSFWIAFQYAVIARSYVLFPLLLFTLCLLYTSERPRVLSFAVVSALLANLCLQGAILSGFFTVVYAFDLLRRRLPQARSVKTSRWLAAGALMLAAWTISIYTAIPAPDVTFAIGDQLQSGPKHDLLMKVVGEPPGTVIRTYTAPPPYDFDPAPYPEIAPAPPDFHKAPRAWMAYQLRMPPFLTVLSADTANNLFTVTELISEATWPISNSTLFSLLVICSLVLVMYRWRCMYLLLPPLALLLIGEFLWVADHHTGMFFLSLLAAVWIAAALRRADPPRLFAPRRIDPLFIAALSLALALQVCWTAYCCGSDLTSTYDPGHEAALYMQRHPVPRTAMFHFEATGVEPWFDHNPFFNTPSSWWQWNSNVAIDEFSIPTLESHPDRVLYSSDRSLPDAMRNQVLPLNEPIGPEVPDSMIANIQNYGYRETHRFCGRRFARFAAPYEGCILIYDRTR